MNAPSASRTDDDLELGALIATLTRSWWRLLLGAAAGGGLGLGLALVIPPQWEGNASVLVRGSDSPAAMLAKGIPDGLATSLLGKDASGQMETELALLRSRRLLQEVADELPLGVQLLKPRVPVTAVVRSYHPAGNFKPFRVEGRRTGARWQLTAEGLSIEAGAGDSVRTPAGWITLADSAPATFSLRLFDREETARRALKRLSVTRLGGDIAGVSVRWEDSLTAAALPNALVARYLAWRLDTDSGDNSKRARFVRAQADSVRRVLEFTLDSLRRFQEQTSQMDPAITGKMLLENAVTVEERLRAVTLESEALGALLSRLERGDQTVARQLPAFPAFLKSPAINDLLSQILKLDGERQALLATRTEADPQVMSRTTSIRNLEASLRPLAETYQSTLVQDRTHLSAAADSIRTVLSRLPQEGQRYFQVTRQVGLLSQSLMALEVQRLQLRLASIEEGGKARQVDVAEPTRKPAQPSMPLFVGGGLALGLLAGVASALARGARRNHGVPA